MLVVDASVAVTALLASDGFGFLDGEQLVAPPLLWPETRSALHVMAFRGEEARETTRAAAHLLDEVRIEPRAPAALGRDSWRIADELGWGKTYDAEYVALAQILDCRLLTLDMRLRRGTDHLGFVVTPGEL